MKTKKRAMKSVRTVSSVYRT